MLQLQGDCYHNNMVSDFAPRSGAFQTHMIHLVLHAMAAAYLTVPRVLFSEEASHKGDQMRQLCRLFIERMHCHRGSS